jgi:hypothetical protein
VLANEHHPPPSLDDVTEWPQIPGQPGSVQRLIQVLLEPSAVSVRQRRTDQLDPLGQVGAGRPLGHAHATLLTGQTGRPLSLADKSLLGATLACQAWPPLGKPNANRQPRGKQTASPPTVIPPEYGPRHTIQRPRLHDSSEGSGFRQHDLSWPTGHHPPHPPHRQPNAARQSALLSLTLRRGWPGQRCAVHFVRDMLGHVPKSRHPLVRALTFLAHLDPVRRTRGARVHTWSRPSEARPGQREARRAGDDDD